MKTFEVQIAAWVTGVEAETKAEASAKVETWLKAAEMIDCDPYMIELDDGSSFLARDVNDDEDEAA